MLKQSSQAIFDTNLIALKEGLTEVSFEKYEESDGIESRVVRFVVDNIDEGILSPVFGKRGAGPYAPRVLIGMRIVKEGLNMSVARMLSDAKTNLALRRAIGLGSYEVKLPTKATYYNFFGRIKDYDIRKMREIEERNKDHRAKGEEPEEFESVYALVIEDAIGKLLKKLDLTCEEVRMDSVLMGSNIASMGRYRLTVSTLRSAVGIIDALQLTLPSDLRKRVDAILSKNEKQAEYKDSKQTKQEKMLEVGKVIKEIIVSLGEKNCGLLPRLLKDQYCEEGGELKVRASKEIQGKSLQSPYDPDAQYRKKGDMTVKGYVVNLIETVGESCGVNLILSGNIKPSCTADQDMVKPALDDVKRISGNTPAVSYQDGGFQSADNAKVGDTEMIFTGFQGPKSLINFSRDKSGKISGINTLTGKAVDVVESKKKTGYLVKYENEKGEACTGYFSKKKIDGNIRRQEQENLPAEIKRKRNNVEAAMFELIFPTRNRKTRYRGLESNLIFVFSRILWIDIRRITVSLERKAAERRRARKAA